MGSQTTTCIALVVLQLLALTQVSTSQERAAVPSDADQIAAMKIVSEIYKADYENAKTREAKLALAKKLLQEGRATNNDPTGQFVLIKLARDIAVKQSNAAIALDAVESLAKSFQTDPTLMKGATLSKILSNPPAEVQERQQLLQMTKPLVDEMLREDHYDAADDLLRNAGAMAHGMKDLTALRQINSNLERVQDNKGRFQEFEVAELSLKQNGDQPAAHLVVGKFYCFTKGDWDKGLPSLALASDKTLSQLAQAELADNPDPMLVADQWWTYSEGRPEGLDEAANNQIRLHAANWYSQAIPSLTGLHKSKAEKRVRDVVAVSGKVKAVEDKARVIVTPGVPAAGRSLAPHKIKEFKGFTGSSAIMQIAYSPDGKLLAAVDEKTVRIWDLVNDNELERLTGASERVFSIAFSKDGKHIAGGCIDKTVRIWDAGNATLKTTIEGSQYPVTDVQFSPDGSILATDDGSKYRTWQISGRSLGVIDAECLAFSPTQKRFAVVRRTQAAVLNIQNNQSLGTIEGLHETARKASYSPDGNTLAVLYISGSKRLDLIDLEKLRIKFSLTLPKMAYSIAFSPDGSLIASAGDGMLSLWNTRTGQELCALTPYGVRSVVFSPNGKSFAFSRSSGVEIWDLEN